MATYKGRDVTILGEVFPGHPERLSVYNNVLKENQIVNKGEVFLTQKEEDDLLNRQQKAITDTQTERANKRAAKVSQSPAWVAGTTYASGAKVSHSGSNYTSGVAGNLGNTPAVPSSFWNKDAVVVPVLTKTPVATTVPVIAPASAVTTPVSPHQLRVM